MFTRALRVESYTAVINPPNPPVWSLWGCVMKMFSILRKFVPSLARRRVTPSPASTTYWVPLTTSRFEDCARPTVGNGPFFVPNVMTRVPLDTSLLGCALANRNNAGSAAAPAVRCRNFRRPKGDMERPSFKTQRRSLQSNDHRLVARQRLHAHIAETGFAHPTDAIRTGKIETARTGE